MPSQLQVTVAYYPVLESANFKAHRSRKSVAMAKVKPKVCFIMPLLSIAKDIVEGSILHVCMYLL